MTTTSVPSAGSATIWITLGMSCLALITAGCPYAFASFSGELQTKFGFSSQDINTMSSVGTSSLFIGYILVGPVWDRFGIVATASLASLCFGIGFLAIYLAYLGSLSGPLVSIGAVSVYYFIAGLGSCACFIVCYGVNLTNFSPKYSGLVSGILGTFYALSITIYSQIHNQFYADNTTGFLLFLTLTTFGINLLSAFVITRVPSTQHLSKTRSDSNAAQSLYATKAGTVASSSASQASTSLWEFEQPQPPIEALLTEPKPSGYQATLSRNTLADSLDYQRPPAIDSVSGFRAVDLSDFRLSIQSPTSARESILSSYAVNNTDSLAREKSALQDGNDSIQYHHPNPSKSVILPGQGVSFKSPSPFSMGDESVNEFRKTRESMDMGIELRDSNPIASEASPKPIQEQEIIESHVKDATPKEILLSTVFGFLLYIWQQGVVYFNNVNSLTKSIVPPSDGASATTQQLTILSISQVIGRITVGPASDYMIQRFPQTDRSLFHFLNQSLVLLPFALLAFLPLPSSAVLSFCSAIVGYTFGGIWVLYPPLLTGSLV
ncbi:MFS general substrate transporter [Rhizoclosmatium globosum]|uniref:MFS general substrate transporter n=1 Tax=Rhizoclosmatium globosum TaxID=329046 RepID=A0A1Y2BB35_9FUNG|nr:MFS general substrate transporter [Rhizoclosmatium globosum]|eukprot:ORY31750.1 MFS general substrate transporter [Rhizoclosmatium globosum]